MSVISRYARWVIRCRYARGQRRIVVSPGIYRAYAVLLTAMSRQVEGSEVHQLGLAYKSARVVMGMSGQFWCWVGHRWISGGNRTRYCDRCGMKQVGEWDGDGRLVWKRVN